ncbi:MAG: GTPase Era [Rickettsiales bacterium]|nr:GTPase Era [Rickettsiales bacterium]
MEKCGYIALLGAPNAGKSTLMNNLVGTKLAIVTPKAQTTRARMTGICIHDASQLIFIDVPGVFDAGEKPFEKAMVASAWAGVADADIVLVMVDAKRGLDDENKALITRLKDMGKPAALVLNKIDTVAKEVLLELASEAQELYSFSHIFMISALKGEGVSDVKDYVAESVPEGPWLYPEDQLTDAPERLMASEITREKCFFKLREELPYALTVETESWEERKDGSIKINQVIYVQREGQKGIVLGKQGAMLKAIGEASRKEIEALWETKVHLFLFVKVRENWKSNPDTYRYMGLEFTS